MTQARIKEFLFQDEDYFVAMTDRGAVRIGLKGASCFDIPAGHAYFDRVNEASNREAVEEIHDELVSLS